MNMIPTKFYFNDIFDDFLPTKVDNKMKCDIFKKDGKYHLEMDIPGFNKEDIKISYDKGYLNVDIEKTSNESEEEKEYVRRERTYTKYSRSFYVGDIEEDEINATLENGTLLIELPNEKDKTSNQKYIEIK